MQVNYAPTGSSDGRSEFLQGTVDFAASDIPFQSHPEDGSNPETPAAGSYAYIPVTAGGTVFMYNLHINGQRVTNLRLSGQNIAKIFTAKITTWNDPAIAADNPQLTLPNETIVPVVRSDGSGSTAQFSLWMISQYASIWNADPNSWHFLTGTPAEVKAVCRRFGLNFWPDEGSLAHSMHTLVIDREGKLAANFEGNQFSAEQLGDFVGTTLDQGR